MQDRFALGRIGLLMSQVNGISSKIKNGAKRPGKLLSH